MEFLFQRNISFFREIRTHFGPVRAEVMEIGDGLLAVKTEDDYDIIFDTGRWKLVIEVKESYLTIIFPPTLSNAGILPGKMLGGVADREKILRIVRQKLVRLAEHYQLVEERRKETGKKGPAKSSSGDMFDFGNFRDLFSGLGGENNPFEDFFKKKP